MRFSIMNISHQKYLAILAAVFAVEFAVLAIAPHHRADWALENILVLVVALVLGLSAKNFPLSRISYTLIFIFLMLHEIGSHYTYAEVPYDEWLKSLAGFSLNDSMGWERNHFDRFIHFAFGLLLAYPIRELYCRIAVTHDMDVRIHLGAVERIAYQKDVRLAVFGNENLRSSGGRLTAGE